MSNKRFKRGLEVLGDTSKKKRIEIEYNLEEVHHREATDAGTTK